MKTFTAILYLLCTATIWCDKKEFKPGNTLKNCDPVIRCANCRGYNLKSSFRTIDGTCNNLRKRTQGAAHTELGRYLRADYYDRRKVDTPRGFPGSYYKPPVPTPHEVSRALFEVTQQNGKNQASLSVIFMTFGQFLDHDMTLTPHGKCVSSKKDCSSITAYKYPCFPIKFTRTGSTCTEFSRSRAVCQPGLRKRRNQINLLSAYIDGSQIYSNDFKTHQSLKKLDGSGELKITTDQLLPVAKRFTDTGCRNPVGCSLVGDERGDENIALTSMHILWVRNHNYLAKRLKRLNRRWSEHRIFETSRKINGALLQHIVYTEYLPFLVQLKPYSRYNHYADASIRNVFSTVAFRYGHSLVPNSWAMLDKGFNKVSEPVPLQFTFFNSTVLRRDGVEPTMYGLLGNQSQDVDTLFSFGVARRLFVPPGKSTYRDLTALNINRGRDHGIPTYGHWRRKCKLKALKTFKDLWEIMPQKAIKELQKLYKHPNDIDLFAAGIAEIHSNGKEIGETFQCIIKSQFEALRDGDRFYYENPKVFSKRQLIEIKKMSLAKVLCNNLKHAVSMQVKAFVVPGKVKRKECRSIPGMDLSAWSNVHG